MGKIDHPPLEVWVTEKAIKPIVMEPPIGCDGVTHPAIYARINAPIVQTLTIAFGNGFKLNHGENSEGLEAEMQSP